MTRPQLVVSSSGASSLLPSYTPTDTSPGAAGGFIIEITIKPSRPILPRCGLQTHRVSDTISSELIFGELSVLVEIGVALTTFGGLFMILGVMLFFDGALLALGNVRLSAFCAQHLISIPTAFSFHSRVVCCVGTVTLPLRPYAYHRSSKDLLLLRTKAKTPRDSLFHWWNPVGVPQVAIYWHDCGDYWFLEPLWVCIRTICPFASLNDQH